MHRSEDRLVPVEHGRYIAAHIPGAQFVELPGDDHFFFSRRRATRISNEIEEFLTGERHGERPDRVLATILFTDIVGSTERAARARRLALARVSSTASTASPGASSSASAAARSTRRATASSPPSTARRAPSAAPQAIREGVRPLGLEVRAGVHTGECEVMGDKIGGIAVHIGARVAAQGWRGRGAGVEHRQGPGRRLGHRVRRSRRRTR